MMRKNYNTVAVKIIYPFRLLGTCVVRLKRFRFYNVLKALQSTVPLLITVARQVRFAENC